jgi:hypothetical protein
LVSKKDYGIYTQEQVITNSGYFSFQDNKLLWRKPDGLAIMRIDYLSEKLRLGKAAGLDIANIYDSIDAHHIIVELDKRYLA